MGERLHVSGVQLAAEGYVLEQTLGKGRVTHSGNIRISHFCKILLNIVILLVSRSLPFRFSN